MCVGSSKLDFILTISISLLFIAKGEFNWDIFLTHSFSNEYWLLELYCGLSLLDDNNSSTSLESLVIESYELLFLLLDDDIELIVDFGDSDCESLCINVGLLSKISVDFIDIEGDSFNIDILFLTGYSADLIDNVGDLFKVVIGSNLEGELILSKYILDLDSAGAELTIDDDLDLGVKLFYCDNKWDIDFSIIFSVWGIIVV